MLFNSLEFLLFFPIVVLMYYILPPKVRYIQLLAASYYFYMCWNAKYALLLLFSTVVTYLCGLVLEKIKHLSWEEGRIIRAKKICVAVGVILNLSVLFFFKYLDFAISNLNRILNIANIEWNAPAFDIILPVGISFFTFQALGYIIDVYRDDIYAEKNFLRYALFISFFPQLVAGPIERSKNLLVQLQKTSRLKWVNFRNGMLLILWGLFLKLVIADRAAIIVNAVYGAPETYRGFYILVATFLFAFQIYCDFYGYSIIAKGASCILDIQLMNNFDAPYFSRSVKEFWQRWHISLSSWFRDYLYIPLGGNRKGAIKKERNRLIVFGLSGLWHGASISFIAWGLLNGIYQTIADFRVSIKKKLPVKICENKDSLSSNIRKTFVTFCLICFTWIFFRAGDMSDALLVIRNLFELNWYILFDGSLYSLGISEIYFRKLIFFICVLLFVDYLKYKKVNVVEQVMEQEWWFKGLIYLLLFFMVVLFGCYGNEYDASQFIYFQF